MLTATTTAAAANIVVTATALQADSSDPLGLCTLTWALVSLIEAWADRENPFSSVAFGEIMHIARRQQQVPLSRLLAATRFSASDR
jgi:hypothetical protein